MTHGQSTEDSRIYTSFSYEKLGASAISFTKLKHDMLCNCDEQQRGMLLSLISGKYRSRRSYRAERWKVKGQRAPFGLRVPDSDAL